MKIRTGLRKCSIFVAVSYPMGMTKSFFSSKRSAGLDTLAVYHQKLQNEKS